MARLTYAQATDKADRLYTDSLLAILASGQNPDGTPFMLPVESTTAPAEAGHATVSVVPNTWTTIVSFTPTTDRALMAAMADLAAVLAARYQIRLMIGGVEQIRETVHTDQVSSIPLHGLRVPSGAVVLLQALHMETLAQDITGTLIHRA